MLFLSKLKIVAIVLLFIFLTLIDCGRDFYKILGVPKNANHNQIKKAYRKLAKELHPDRNQGDENAGVKFQDLGAAYECLSDPKKRSIYDKHGEEGLKNGHESDFGSFNPFKDFFGGAFGDDEAEEVVHKGADVNVDLWVSLDELYNGAIIDIERVKAYYKETSGTRKCNCRLEMKTQSMGPGSYQMFQVQVCDDCPNKRLVQENVDYHIEIEKGFDEGHEIIQYGDGEPHMDGDSGDLVFKIRIEKHSIFERQGLDLLTNLTISLEQALNGFSTTIKHMDGHEVVLERNKITPPFSKIRKRGEGMPDNSNNLKKGDLIITIDIDFPKGELTKDEKSEISKILKQNSYKPKIHNGL
uniref:DnaJ homolog dnj-20 n=1 Tax=Parastrongyloides trichosuri TaxID=131310 RepID=A0A0N4ZYW4_PARTI